MLIVIVTIVALILHQSWQSRLSRVWMVELRKIDIFSTDFWLKSVMLRSRRWTVGSVNSDGVSEQNFEQNDNDNGAFKRWRKSKWRNYQKGKSNTPNPQNTQNWKLLKEIIVEVELKHDPSRIKINIRVEANAASFDYNIFHYFSLIIIIIWG